MTVLKGGCDGFYGGVAVLQEMGQSCSGVWQSCRGCGSPEGGVTVLQGVW